MQQEVTMSRRKSIEHCEVYTANSWVFSDPLGRLQHEGTARQSDFPKHPKDGNAQRASICIAGLIHTVHEKEPGQGPGREITATPRSYEAKHILGNTKTWKKGHGRSDFVYEECRASTLQLLPDRYVCFTINPQLTTGQSQYMSRERWREFPDYLSEASHHGSHNVYSALYSTIMRYAEVMHSDDIYIKIGGTRHRKYEVCYIAIVCANVGGRDPLPQLPTLTHSESIKVDSVLRPGSFLDMEGRVVIGSGKYTPKWATSVYEMPRFSPHSTVSAINGLPQYCDTMEFAFHFPSAVLYYPLLMSPTLVEHFSCITADRDRKGCMETMTKKRKLW